MPEPAFPQAYSALMRARGESLRAKDQPPATALAWQTRRNELREAMFEAMGPVPERPGPLEPRVLGTLKRPGYRIEKLVFQSRPNIWVTGSLYLPDPAGSPRPAVLVVHGHWAGARR